MKVKIEVAAGISALISFLECRCHSGFGPPRSESASGYGPPLRSLDPIPNFPVKHRLHHIW